MTIRIFSRLRMCVDGDINKYTNEYPHERATRQDETYDTFNTRF